MEDILTYTYAHPKFFERLRYTPFNASYRDLLMGFIPADWQTGRSDIWIEVRPAGAELQEQGFKIHISSSIESALDTIRVVAPHLIQAQTAFKLVADPALHRLINSKRFPRQSSGKFITIYPDTLEQFAALTGTLTKMLSHLGGPYILSDRRCSGSHAVFYRYGGFLNLAQRCIDGTRQLVIKGADGKAIPDTRAPFFQLPLDILDPFPQDLDDGPSTPVLIDRYRIEEALTFSTTGGVYRATDFRTGSPVVIKEARPHTLILAGSDLKMTAIRALQHERRCLEYLQSIPNVPRFVDYFTAWENHYLVESYANGVSFASLRAQEKFIFMERMGDSAALSESCATWKDIALRLLRSVRLIHASGVILGDISPVNIIRNPSNGDLTFIDFESSLIKAIGPSIPVEFNARWAFPGFRPNSPRNTDSLTFRDDFYACGMLLYNLICPIHNLFELDKEYPRDVFIEHFVEGGLPAQMADSIHALWKGEPDTAEAILNAFDPLYQLKLANQGNVRTVENNTARRERTVSSGTTVDSLANSITSLAQGILTLTDTSRNDRLWPADAMVFRTNPLSIAHGACGIALFLKKCLGMLPDQVSQWILAKKVTPDSYPPGLYTGMAGIAWCFAELGWLDRAGEIMNQVPESPLAYESPFLYDGIAGWGLASLEMSAVLAEAGFLEIAIKAGQRLLEDSIATPHGLQWNSETEPTPLGMAFGNSGIALFFINLWRVTEERDFLVAAMRAMENEIAHGRPRERDGALLWGPAADARVQSPYWLRGAGGVASALVRLYDAVREERYLSLAKRSAIPCMSYFSAAPHVLEGLASMGETLLDLYQITGEQAYYDAALLKVRQTLLFACKYDDNIAFPGRYLMRFSCDYATGAAGIGMFLWRFHAGTPRLFHDLSLSHIPVSVCNLTTDISGGRNQY